MPQTNWRTLSNSSDMRRREREETASKPTKAKAKAKTTTKQTTKAAKTTKRTTKRTTKAKAAAKIVPITAQTGTPALQTPPKSDMPHSGPDEETTDA